MTNGTVTHCSRCGEHTYVTPLYGDKGGPPFCPLCAGAWHAEHTKRRKWGRIIVKAMKAYEREGGSYRDFDTLKLVAMGLDVMHLEADTLGADVSDITTELLDDAIQLTHPDPGEMADADFGYVGAGTARVNLYVGKEVVARGVSEATAPDRLVDIIREQGAWHEPSGKSDS